MSITIKFGLDNSVTRDINGYRTSTDVLGDRNLQAVLGFGADGYEAAVNGSREVRDLRDGDIVDIVSAGNKKSA